MYQLCSESYAQNVYDKSNTKVMEATYEAETRNIIYVTAETPDKSEHKGEAFADAMQFGSELPEFCCENVTSSQCYAPFTLLTLLKISLLLQQ